MTPRRPGTYDLALRRGSKYQRPFTYKIDDVAVNLTGYTARAQIRRKADPESAVLFEATTANDKLEITDAVGGEMTLTITATETADFDFNLAVWDLELLPGDVEADAFALLEGSVTVDGQVTQ